MAHEKLSPRQRMIGMMYLVLTAMLALNVQKEVVKAFMKVDKGLTNTVNNYVQKNNLIYEDFESSFAQFPEKTGPYRNKALEVKQRAQELYDYIQGLKIQMITEADGPNAKAINKATNEIDIELVDKYDENNIPSEQLVGANEDGKGYELMKIISEYKDFLISNLEGKAPAITESLTKTLSTEEGKGEDGQLEPWPNVTFQLMPLVGASALLTKIQVDVRNAETEVINYLFSQITKADIKVNKLKAVVIPKSTYVTVGSNYEASILLSALDTTRRPVIKVEGTQIDLDDLGRGIYIVRGTGTGLRRYNGVVTINTSEGTTDYAFDGEYMVGESNATVSASAVNILYTGIDNPLDISIPGIRPDRIKVKTNGTGTVSKKRVQNARTKEYFPGEWAITPTIESGIVEVIVTAEDENGKPTSYPSKKFRVKNVPTPVAEFALKSSGKVSKGTLIANDEVYAVLKDFEFDLNFKVAGFTIMFPGSFGNIPVISNSSKLTPEQKTQLAKMTKGQRLIFDEITARGPTGKIIGLSPIILQID
jgi:gliding motility-associated protein GldM